MDDIDPDYPVEVFLNVSGGVTIEQQTDYGELHFITISLARLPATIKALLNAYADMPRNEA
jgi:hypothetical protein